MQWKDGSLLDEKDPQRGLRYYQARIVEQVSTEGAHIMLPECAGSAVVGVELIRRLEQPAVVFAPTVAAQLCWQDQLARFADPALSTLDSRVPAPTTLLSYFDLQTAETATALLSNLAIDAWVTELVTAGRTCGEASARARIDRGKAHNPRKFDRTLTRRRAQLAATLLHGPASDLGRYLSPMTRRLIETLVAQSVQVIMLHACDQVSDGWAIALRYLAHRIAVENGPPTVIGLSTMPHNVPEAHRYCRHVVTGQDVSWPAPALVYEQAIAPYRDLAHFVRTESEKARAAAEILGREQTARPGKLRAVVLTEREAGGWDVLHALLTDERARELAPVLLTGDGLAVERSRIEGLLTSCAAILRRLDLHACCRTVESTAPTVDVIVGEGPDWSARIAATLGVWALDSGMTRCLVRAADSTVTQDVDNGVLDTFVDLTRRHTVAAAKLRGEALRLDESVPGKVAHIWHVVARDHADVQRFARQMQDYWGLAFTEPRGRVVRGPAVLDYMLASGAFDAVDYRWITVRCLAEIGDRETCRRQWMSGARARIAAIASVDGAQFAQPRSLLPLLGWLGLPLLLVAALLIVVITDGTVFGYQVARWLWLAAGLAVAALVTASARRAIRVFKAARGSVESRLLALGRAVLDALRKSGHLDSHVRTACVRARRVGQRYELAIQDGSRQDAQVFATALVEALTPPRGQRCVVAAGSHPIPVPSALSRQPELFLRAWRRHGGMGRLADSPPASTQPGAVAFEVWAIDLPESLDVPAGRRWTSTDARYERCSGTHPPIGQSSLLNQSARTPTNEPLVTVHRGELLGRHAEVGLRDLASVRGHRGPLHLEATTDVDDRGDFRRGQADL
jgi:hypothetical protein